MSIHGMCFDVGSSGNCCDNCYKCAYNFGDESMTDEEVIKRLGKEEQERMLKEYESED